jgi:exosortase/archaeosortase family protein
MNHVLAPAGAVAGPLAQRLRCGRTGLPPLAWLGLQVAALWPHGHWMAQRLTDGSDDPLGLAALAVLALAVWRGAPQWLAAPRPGWLAAAAGLTAAATVGLWWLPPLACALLGALALAAAVAAWLPPGAARAPLAGLALLALPWIASLQYYAGFPLRVLTAQLSTWALRAAGLAAERSGASMSVNGQLVLVDAPCSGVQMAWMAYFCACAVAALLATRDGSFLRRLPLVGLLVLGGNVLRNTVLVALEARPAGLDETLHTGIGLAVLALVCGAVIALMQAAARSAAAEPESFSTVPEQRAQRRPIEAQSGRWPWPQVLGAWLLGCALLPLARAADAPQAPSTSTPHEWPQERDGRLLRPLASHPVEERFAAHFPGRIGRFTDGRHVVVLRQVQRPTRMLHPAADCYRALGYRIERARLEHDAQARLWRCFVARRGGERLRVCERIEAGDGAAFADASSWFWAASLGRSRGPWQAITQVESL